MHLARSVAFLLSSSFLSVGFSGCGASTKPGNGGGDGGAMYADCVDNSGCVIRARSCCGQCGTATREDIVALNKEKVTAYQTAHCGDTFGCPACYGEQDARLIATCAASSCEVVDLALHTSTECAKDADCRIRTNVCCECGGPTDAQHIVAIAVNGEASFSALVCDEGQGCPECAPVYPPNATAVCVKGHCQAGFRGP